MDLSQGNISIKSEYAYCGVALIQSSILYDALNYREKELYEKTVEALQCFLMFLFSVWINILYLIT